MPKFSIVIPCFNEAESIPTLIREITTQIDRDDVEVVIVNNGSTDGTASVLKEVLFGKEMIKLVTLDQNQGYGGGILAGLRHANGEYIGWMHGDLQTPFAHALAACGAIEKEQDSQNIYIKGARLKRPLFDRFFTGGMSVFESVLFQRIMVDINAQPNLFHRSFFNTWEHPPTDFALDLYALIMAHQEGLTIVRVPVLFPARQFGSSKWNTGLSARWKFIRRIVSYSMHMRTKSEDIISTLHRFVFLKYLLAGGVAGMLHLALLYFFTDVLGIYYLWSTSVALFIVFWVSFLLQKYWTFTEHSRERFRSQAAIYLVMHTGNFFTNGALMYLLVDVYGVWHMFAQVMVSLSIAMVTYLINKHYIFVTRPEQSDTR